MTIDEIRNHAKESGLPDKRIDALVAELHPDESGKLSIEESAQALVTVNYIADTKENVRAVLEATRASRNQQGRTEAQKKAKKKYRDQGKRLTIDFYPSEADLIEQIEKQPNKQGYIKGLIRASAEHKGCAFCEDLDRIYEAVCYIPNDNGGAMDIPMNHCPNCGAKIEW